MIFRAIITSGIFSAIYAFLFVSIIPNIQNAQKTFYLEVFLLWSLGLLSILGFIYGRRIKRILRSETGRIKWFDPSKGYGFLIRDKGGDLFVHLRAVRPEDRRKLRENTRVRFKVEETERGPQAENIKII